jgi:hypothetical protein
MLQAEKEIQTEVLHYLKENGWLAFKNHTGGIRRSGQATVTNPMKGAPDIFALSTGIFMGVEVKKRGGVISMEQYRWLDDIKSHGGIALVCDSLDSFIAQLDKQLDKYGIE